MNAFWLDTNLTKAAQAHPTKYTKIILESGQCLCSALHNNGLGEISPYGAGYNHHPISQWAAESSDHWYLLRDYMDALTQQYYDISYDELKSMESAVEYWENNDVHKTPCSIADAGVEEYVDTQFDDAVSRPPPKTMFDFCKEDTVVESYRKYVVCVKSHYDWWEWSTSKPDWYDKIKHKYKEAYRRGQFYVASDERRDSAEDLIPSNSK